MQKSVLRNHFCAEVGQRSANVIYVVTGRFVNVFVCLVIEYGAAVPLDVDLSLRYQSTLPQLPIRL